MRKAFLFSCIAVWLLGCDSDTLYKNGEYSVSWVDSKRNQVLRFKHEGIIPECLAKLGENEKFIVVEGISKNNESVFYIIDKELHGSTWNKQKVQGIYGPMSHEKFEEQRQGLFANLQFTFVSDNCE